MSYFSRLTDIVTCNLTDLLAQADNPARALAEIVSEMEEGVAGATRSLETSRRNVARLEAEVLENRSHATRWHDRTKEELKKGDDAEARLAIMRRREYEALVAGLEQQLKAAIATREHMATTLRALEARLADAVRRQTDLGVQSPHQATQSAFAADEIDQELEQLRREMKGT